MFGVDRGIRDRLLTDLATAPVVLLEGLRASGKTWLARHLVDEGYLRTYVDLTDEPTRERFARDPASAVADLSRPAVIDEAQLVPEVLLSVKRFADADGAAGSFLLTGSARLRRDQLGGSDPLVGRAAVARLRPMTRGEQRGAPVNLVDQIFDGALEHRQFRQLTTRDLERTIRGGGLPTMPGVLRGTTLRANELLHTYVQRTLDTPAGFPRRDVASLSKTFRYLAGNPAQVLVVERVASDLGMNRKTVDAYLDELEARFLIERIPGWRASASAGARAHPKLHVTDSGLAAAFASTRSVTENDDAPFGGRVESFVVMELITQSSWSQRTIRAFHWRDSRTHAEVDLLLVDPDGRTIAVEIKASTSVSRRDFTGIEALAKRHRIDLGLVLYAGGEQRMVDRDRWAVPISALWDTSGADARPAASAAPERHGRHSQVMDNPRPPENTSMTDLRDHHGSDAALFLSYVRADDEAEHGRIRALANDIAARFELVTGDTLPVFVDRDIEWGEQWKHRLDLELAATTYFVPVVTPRFLKSGPCRQEVLEFVSKAAELGHAEFVMPILYLRPPNLDSSPDPVAAAIRDSQWVDWQKFRYLERESGTYRAAIDQLVQRLDTARQEASRRATLDGDDSAGASDNADLLAHVESATRHLEMLQQASADLLQRLDQFGASLLSAQPVIERAARSSSPTQLRAALKDFAEPLRVPASDLENAGAQLGSLISKLDRDVSSLFFAARDPSLRPILGDLRGLVDELEQLDSIDLDQAHETERTLHQISRVARELQPTHRAISATVQAITDLASAVTRWRRDAEAIDP